MRVRSRVRVRALRVRVRVRAWGEGEGEGEAEAEAEGWARGGNEAEGGDGVRRRLIIRLRVGVRVRRKVVSHQPGSHTMRNLGEPG